MAFLLPREPASQTSGLCKPDQAGADLLGDRITPWRSTSSKSHPLGGEPEFHPRPSPSPRPWFLQLLKGLLSAAMHNRGPRGH